MEDYTTLHARGVQLLGRLERAYLTALRIVPLLLATILVLFAAWQAISGLYKVSRDAETVVTAPTIVSATDIATLPKDISRDNRPSRRGETGDARVYRPFVDRYYALYTRAFAPFRRDGDPRLTRAAFDARFVRSDDRLASTEAGSLIAADDLKDLKVCSPPCGTPRRCPPSAAGCSNTGRREPGL